MVAEVLDEAEVVEGGSLEVEVLAAEVDEDVPFSALPPVVVVLEVRWCCVLEVFCWSFHESVSPLPPPVEVDGGGKEEDCC